MNHNMLISSHLSLVFEIIRPVFASHARGLLRFVFISLLSDVGRRISWVLPLRPGFRRRRGRSIGHLLKSNIDSLKGKCQDEFHLQIGRFRRLALLAAEQLLLLSVQRGQNDRVECVRGLRLTGGHGGGGGVQVASVPIAASHQACNMGNTQYLLMRNLFDA